MPTFYENNTPIISGNKKLREPQEETYLALKKFSEESTGEKEAGIILPVGCGKSGCIACAPFAFKAKRTLVVAPNLNIADQLRNELDPAHEKYFYKKASVLSSFKTYPELVEIRGKSTNKSDLNAADIVVTNIQQLQGNENRWLQSLSDDFFDLILFDEGHHAVAESWSILKSKFPTAKIVNFSATPLRADGQMMSGHILYSYPIFKAIKAGYVKRLKGVVLNPKTLRYIRREDDQEIEVSLEEVRRLGEEDADFRRSIVTSAETLNTIVDASIRELDKRRKETGDNRLKIIASALNHEHCRQIVAAYNARGRKADYVHSKEDDKANKQVMNRLENNQIDVIVQVRKLGEGFDHPFLVVAAIFSIFSNLSPFVQFVGRIMRVIKQDAPNDLLNKGTVVFHSGGNIARRWVDFQDYSEADKEFFDQLLPLEDLDFSSSDELIVEPDDGKNTEINEQIKSCEIKSQAGVHIEEIPLLKNDPEVENALRLLKEKGYTSDQLKIDFEELDPVPVTKQRERQSKQNSLDVKVKNEVGKILGVRALKAEGHDLDTNRLGRTNFVVLKAAIDSKINSVVKKKSGERHELTNDELNEIENKFDGMVLEVISEVFNV